MILKWLKYFREKRGFSQKEIGDRIGVQENTIWRWENEKATPSADKVYVIANLFNILVDELLNGPKGNELKFTIIWEVDDDMTSMAVRENEFKIGFGEREDFGAFSFPKDADVEEIGEQFKRELRAARAGRKARDKALNEMAAD